MEEIDCVIDPALLQEFLSGGEHLAAMQMFHPHMALDAARLQKRFVRGLFHGASGTCPSVLKQVLIFCVYVAAGGPAETIESMPKNILITGGAGFIGAHVANELLAHGHRVRALDSLVPQVHGPKRQRPDYLNPEVELMVGDVRDAGAVSRALHQMDAVVHLVALVGVGQSMYQIDEYTSVNNLGTASLMQALSTRPVESLLVASSMSIYGEGLYRDSDGNTRIARDRTLAQLKAGDWEIRDECGRPLTPVPTPENKSPELASVYALSKYDQERMCLIVGRAYGIRTVALRFFNTYGPYQALSNPYTGVLSNVAARVLNGRAPLIYEDGLQKRDFVSVYDVACACRLALESPAAAGQAFNISSGAAMTVKEIAERTIRAIGSSDLEPEITGKYRSGDIRHCFADISLARRVLGWEPKITLERGLEDLAAWLEGQSAADRGLEARAELATRGLML
jgi:dTDP-L-rhamnose 4-epimerase